MKTTMKLFSERSKSMVSEKKTLTGISTSESTALLLTQDLDTDSKDSSDGSVDYITSEKPFHSQDMRIELDRKEILL